MSTGVGSADGVEANTPAGHAGVPDAGRGEPATFSLTELARATGSQTLPGNRVELQFDGPTTFSSWVESIEAARHFVFFENYLVRDDVVGRRFRDALIAKAESGVPVYLIHDWFGCWATPRSFWKPLKRAGVHVAAFNPPAVALRNPFEALQRDHRKLVVVDGEVAYLGGLCVGVEWAGTSEEAPWRDTGVEIRGPAAWAAAAAFESVWAQVAEPIGHVRAVPRPPAHADGVPVWLIEGAPGRARVYRTLHLMATRARRSIWITDAYFVAPASLSEALAAAALQGVDVRILVPAHNNWPLVGSLSRGGYRALLEAGVRIFEWQGAMIHAKTSVVDGTWGRIGSSNLNSASLLGNFELDVGVLDSDLAGQLEGLFLADLASSVEIVLPGGPTIGGRSVSTAVGMSTESLDPEGSLPERIEQGFRERAGGLRRLTMASAVRAGDVFVHALAGNRTLGREDRTVLGLVSAALVFVGVFAAFFPGVIGGAVAVVSVWLGITMLVRAYIQSRRAKREANQARVSGSQNEEAG